MATSSPFLPDDEDDQPVGLPTPTRELEPMSAVQRAPLLGLASSGGQSMNVLGAQATSAATTSSPSAGLGALTPRVTAKQVDRLIQEKMVTREQEASVTAVDRQRHANVDALIIDQMQDQLTGESTRYAPLRESL